jgi:multidrug efflux pump subunit AcrA (membrane-fusion protein)
MKQGKPLITFVILAMAAVVALYFAAYIFNAMDDPYRTTQVYSYTAYDSVTVEGLVVREARVLPAQPGILEITRAEGEKVGSGQEIALVYRDSQAQASQVQIEELEMEIQLLDYAISQGTDLDSAARLDEDVLEAVVDLLRHGGVYPAAGSGDGGKEQCAQTGLHLWRESDLR